MMLTQNCHAIYESFVAGGVTDKSGIPQRHFLKAISYSGIAKPPSKIKTRNGIYSAVSFLYGSATLVSPDTTPERITSSTPRAV
jgi:hypothetical protein